MFLSVVLRFTLFMLVDWEKAAEASLGRRIVAASLALSVVVVENDLLVHGHTVSLVRDL